MHRAGITAVALTLLLGLVLGGAVGHPTGASSPLFSAIYQTPTNVTEQSAFSVHLQVSDTTNIKQVYFTFCQLTSSLCYLPIVMDPQPGNWFVGTTGPMTSYNGMNVGVHAGYNITILFNDNSIATAPTVPNPFSNLTLAQTVTGEYVYDMSVADHVYGLGGVVYGPTGAPVSGANVTLNPGNHHTTSNATGAYFFGGLFNGTYFVLVTGAGYPASNVSVSIAGQNVAKDVKLAQSAPTDSGSPSGPFAFLTSATGLLGLVLILLAVAVLGYLLYSRSGSRKRGPPPADGASESPRTDTGAE